MKRLRLRFVVARAHLFGVPVAVHQAFFMNGTRVKMS